MKPVHYENATDEVRAVYDDIKRTRGVKDVNNFWKYVANHPVTLKRIWENLKIVMGPGALDPLTKELIYYAISVSNNCEYCRASHGAAARAKGATDEMMGEVLAIVGMANETNQLSNGYGVEIDDALK